MTVRSRLEATGQAMEFRQAGTDPEETFANSISVRVVPTLCGTPALALVDQLIKTHCAGAQRLHHHGSMPGMLLRPLSVPIG